MKKVVLEFIGTFAIVVMAIGIVFYLNAVIDHSPLQEWVLPAFSFGAVVAIASFGISLSTQDGLKIDIKDGPKAPPDELRNYANLEGRKL